VGQHRLDHVERPGDVHVDHPLPIFEAQIAELDTRHVHARIVHQHVDAAVRIQGGLDCILGGAALRDICTIADRPSAAVVDGRFQRLGVRLTLAVREQNAMTGCGQRHCRRTADTARAAGHQCDPIAFHVSSLTYGRAFVQPGARRQ
jgi:hypothetical protein